MFSARFKWSLETNRITQLLAEKRQSGDEIFDLTESNPTRAGFDYPTGEILAALAAPSAMNYEPHPRGLLAARLAVSDYYRSRGVFVAPDQMHLTASTSEAYAYLFKLLADQGDAVLVPQPSYPLFDFLAALEGVELRPYETVYEHPAGWRINFMSLESAVNARTKAVVVVNPNNPTGSFLKRDEVDRLLAFCERNHLALIVDEVFNDYALHEDPARVTSFDPTGATLIFVLNGFSKMLGLPQMKLGWIVTHGLADLRRAAGERLDLIADTFLSVNTPVQCAAPAWLRLREPIQGSILMRIRDNLTWLASRAESSPCRLLKVEGGWCAPLEVPRHEPEEEMVLNLLRRHGVLAHPGYFFDFHREAFLVLSLLPPPEVFQPGVNRLLVALE